jgi:hypothetical protein
MNNPKYYYITRDNPTVKVLLEPQDDVSLQRMNLIKLVLPMCKNVWCDCNYLTELIVPESVELLNCNSNYLKELIIPMSCKYLDCSRNELTKLIILGIPSLRIYRFNRLPQVIIDLFESDDPIKMQLANNLQLTNNLQR